MTWDFFAWLASGYFYVGFGVLSTAFLGLCLWETMAMLRAGMKPQPVRRQWGRR